MNTGLLTSRSSGSDTFIYQYDWLGRATGVILPSGETLKLSSKISNTEGLEISVTQPPSVCLLLEERPISTSLGGGGGFADNRSLKGTLCVPNSFSTRSAVCYKYYIFMFLPDEEVTDAMTLSNSTVALKSAYDGIMMVSAKTTFGDGIENFMSTSFSLVGDVRNPQQTLYREIYVNKSKILGIEFDQFTSKETFFDHDKLPLLTITYDPAGLPLLHGLLSEVSSPLDGTQIFTYDDTNMLSKITLASQKSFTLTYDDNGGLRHVTLPSGTKHSFSLQPSLGFLRATLLQTVFPGEGARVVYRYYDSGKLKEVVHGDGKTLYQYSETGGLPSQVNHVEQDLEYRWDYQYIGGLLMEERIDFGAKTGLSNAKFTYDYDNNYRLITAQGRIGGQNLPQYNLAYNQKTGALEMIGPFKVIRPKLNETNVFDGTALFSSSTNSRFLRPRGNTIPMEYNVMDRIIKFGEGQYKYDSRGLVIQNAREEKFHYNAKGLLVRATKREDLTFAISTITWTGFQRKDNFGNVTQFFYNNEQNPREVNQIYSPRDGKLMSLVYDHRGHLIHAQVYRHKYYVASDQCGTQNRPHDHLDWLRKIGLDLQSLAPQLFPDDLPGGKMPPSAHPTSNILESVPRHPKQPTHDAILFGRDPLGFLAHLNSRKMQTAKELSVFSKSALKTDVINLIPKKLGASSDPPFGRGILVSQTDTGQAIVSSVPAANAIYRDVYTSVFNRSHLLPFTFVVHSAQQDAFYFVKEETWKANDDKGQLKRLQGQVNTTFHEIAKENGSGNNYYDVKIHGSNVVVNLRYGTTVEKEKQRLLHHAKLSVIRKAWHKEKDCYKNGFFGSVEWSANEIEELSKVGYVSHYEGEYIHDVQQYPELAEDPYNIKFTKKQVESSKKRRRKRDLKKSCRDRWWFTFTEIC
ncbi:hypothetical protein NQ318_012076 [Aromia moschata]|uniref:Uncharacterized protein n=1 Tax=Aromia moschata TaxID=1265417 RepID=A0AAV8X3E9_9CUCU|nr:hypothetical protein NQ318_012076 [Aromia moschata]